jgi:phthiodiolone/phenolphthiodiolone dimycocerosates ketoreductase
MSIAPDLGITFATDSIRRGPVEFAQLAASLSAICGKSPHFFVGSGEVKNIRPLGYKRQGLKKMHDTFEAFGLLWDDPSALNYEGEFWTLKKATIGDHRGRRPEIYGMGAGPGLIEHATSYADGLLSVIPLKFQTPDDVRERIDGARGLVEQKGRDPQAFKFSFDIMYLSHPDENVVEKALDNRIVKWMTAIMGRVGTDNWNKAGLESPVPEGWTYYADYVPTDIDEAFVEEILAKVTREHVEASWIFGTPDQVVGQIEPFLETDISSLTPINYLALAVDADTVAEIFAADLELFARIKQSAAA